MARGKKQAEAGTDQTECDPFTSASRWRDMRDSTSTLALAQGSGNFSGPLGVFGSYSSNYNFGPNSTASLGSETPLRCHVERRLHDTGEPFGRPPGRCSSIGPQVRRGLSWIKGPKYRGSTFNYQNHLFCRLRTNCTNSIEGFIHRNLQKRWFW